MKVADAIDHAMYFLFPLIPPHARDGAVGHPGDIPG